MIRNDLSMVISGSLYPRSGWDLDHACPFGAVVFLFGRWGFVWCEAVLLPACLCRVCVCVCK